MRLNFILLIIFVFLSGCASKTSVQKQIHTNWQSVLKQQEKWQSNGKLAFTQAKKTQSANFTWVNQQAGFYLNLTGPFGAQILSMEQNDYDTLLTFEGAQYRDQNAEHLLQKLTGLTLPVADAQLWLKGLPEGKDIIKDEFDRVKSAAIIDTHGTQWKIQYSQYHKNNGYWLPKSIKLSHEDLRVKMKIYSWEIN